MEKPEDASDLRSSGDLEAAKMEILHFRKVFGSYAVNAGFPEGIRFDCDDVIKGINEEEDFERCIQEIQRLRSQLRFVVKSSQKSNHSVRKLIRHYSNDDFDFKEEHKEESK